MNIFILFGVTLLVSVAAARSSGSHFTKETRSDLLYPFAKEDKLDISNLKPRIQRNLNFNLPFYGFNYNFIRVSLNGYLEFTDGPEYYTYPLKFPRNYPYEKDPSFIGPFFSKMRIGTSNSENDLENGVYFREVANLSNRFDEFAQNLKDRVKKDIDNGNIFGAKNFQPEHIVIVTWKGLSFQGGTDSSLQITNTFQALIASDETKSFAIFNYKDINWTTHTEAGGDVVSGEGGIPAFVGFNAGKGTRAFEYHPYSQRFSIKDLTKTGCVNGMNARHIFKIDGKIVPGTCSNDMDYVCHLYMDQN